MPNDSNQPRTGLSFAQAREMLVEVATRHHLPPQAVALDEAFGRMLAVDVVAPRDVPGFSNAAMDGFAVRGEDLPASGEKCFALLGEVLAGGGSAPGVTTGGCVRVTTGAIMPPGADTVVIKENARSDGERIFVQAGTKPGANVRGGDEDYRAGDPALTRGTRLSPPQVAVLAGFGLTRIDVASRPRAAVLTTGDELVAPGESLAYGQIYDSNRLGITGLLHAHGIVEVRHRRVPDDVDALESRLCDAAGQADVVITCGGVSAGEADFLPGIVSRIGQVFFHKLQIRPGMPFLFGRIERSLLFALPGNPVSGYVTFLTLVAPALRAMCGMPPPTRMLKARLAEPVQKRHSRTEFQRARIRCDNDATLWATPYARQGSSILRSLAESDALIMLAHDRHDFALGEAVDMLPLPGWPG